MGASFSRTLAGAALGLSITIVGCSGAMSVADYAAAAGSAAAQYDATTDRLRDDYTEALREPLEAFAALRDSLETSDVDAADTARLSEESEKLVGLVVRELGTLYDEAAAALETMIEAFDELDPPSAVADVHTEYVATLTRSVESVPALVNALAGAQTLRDVDGIINASDFGDTQPRVSALCLELEAALESAGHATDLHCSDATAL